MAAPPTGRVVSSGRTGTIVQYDADDNDLTFKLAFADGEEPEADWFSRLAVEVVSGDLAGGTGTAVCRPDAGKLSDWAPSRPVGTPIQDEGFICSGSKAPICPRPAAGALNTWAPSRPSGTPIQDEGFICAGSKAPICPAPVKESCESVSMEDGPAAPYCPDGATMPTRGPITLEALQGNWQGSGGAQITIIGTDVIMNSMPLKGHKVVLNDDGAVRSIGTLWQLDRWAPSGNGIEFRASSTRENMECARLEVWTRKPTGTDAAFEEKMKLMGYAGSSADIFGRGIEGCMPGTMGIEEGLGSAAQKDREEVSLLCTLVSQWREPQTSKVCSRQVIPDFTNRSQTGIGVELLHFIASSMLKQGFQKREGRSGHDIPVLVRETIGSETGAEALAVWRKRVSDEEGYPPVRVEEDKEFFTSLGNGHFFQSLNLFGCGGKNINDESIHYEVCSDAALQDAMENGVTSIVLRHECPKPVRAKIAALLNTKREFQWTLQPDGRVDCTTSEENTDYCSQFEWLSKGMDAVQVDCLVRTHLRIKQSKRIQG